MEGNVSSRLLAVCFVLFHFNSRISLHSFVIKVKRTKNTAHKLILYPFFSLEALELGWREQKHELNSNAIINNIPEIIRM